MKPFDVGQRLRSHFKGGSGSQYFSPIYMPRNLLTPALLQLPQPSLPLCSYQLQWHVFLIIWYYTTLTHPLTDTGDGAGQVFNPCPEGDGEMNYKNLQLRCVRTLVSNLSLKPRCSGSSRGYRSTPADQRIHTLGWAIFQSSATYFLIGHMVLTLIGWWSHIKLLLAFWPCLNKKPLPASCCLDPAWPGFVAPPNPLNCLAVPSPWIGSPGYQNLLHECWALIQTVLWPTLAGWGPEYDRWTRTRGAISNPKQNCYKAQYKSDPVQGYAHNRKMCHIWKCSLTWC